MCCEDSAVRVIEHFGGTFHIRIREDEKMAEDKKRIARLKKICEGINKGAWGGENNDAVMVYGDNTKSFEIQRFPSGSPFLDQALGGGWPLGRICELYGNESSGKTTLTLHAINEFQKKYPDDDVAFIDSEYAFDSVYAKQLGVNLSTMIVMQPESGEQALNVLSQLIENGIKLVVVDSVAALVTQAELEGAIGDAHVATQARLMSGALKKIVKLTGKNKTCVIFTNQVRDKIGITWGDKSTTPGGKALRFYSSIRVELRCIGKDKEGDTIVSTRVRANVKKNKTANPYKVAEFSIGFGTGIDQMLEILDMAIDNGVIKKKGAWFDVFGESIQGKLNVLNRMKEDEEFLATIEEAIKGDKPEVKEEPEVLEPEEDESEEVEDSDLEDEPEDVVKPAMSLDLSKLEDDE